MEAAASPLDASATNEHIEALRADPSGPPNAILDVTAMTLTLDIPDEIAASLCSAGGNLSRTALGALASESYRRGELSQAQVGRLLGLSRIQTEDFLADHAAVHDYDTGELQREMDALANIGPKRS